MEDASQLPRLFPLYSPDGGIDKATADIIAVHGIETRSPRTWTTYEREEEPRGRAVNWLCDKDMLPRVIPQACIWAYNYNSNCFSDNAQEVDIVGLGNTFLEMMRAKSESGIGKRQLVFIGSCFGGLVIIEALVQASQNIEKFANIYNSTVGVIFLGTPLRGTPIASRGQWIAYLRGLWGKETSLKLLDDILENGTHLDSIVQCFAAAARKRQLQIRCFYETRHTTIGKAIMQNSVLANLFGTVKMVSKDSACLDGHPSIPLDLRHAMMNKYRSSEDGNFILVSSSLKEIVQDPQVSQLSPGLSQEEIRCLQCLTSDYRGGKDRNMQRVSGTCEWVLKHPNFCHWNRDETKLLWISADPGCGKSVLSRALIDEKLVTTNPGTASICYFFFKDDDPSRQTAANALSAILHQLFVQKPRLLPYAMHHFQHHGKHLNTMFDPLWDILKAAANDSESAEIICVIDALDESEEAAAEQLISKLGRYYSPIKGQDIKLRFLITSRPYFSIETVFHNAFDNVATISLRGEDESEKISKEIDLVIHNRIPEICRARRYPLEEKEQNILISTLKQTPNRTYLWLHLIFAVVQKSLESTGTGLKKLINKIPLSVDDAYEKILRKTEKSEDAGQAKQLLHMIVAAYRPLTLQEMNIAWALHEKLEANEECRSFQDLDLPSQEHFKTKIRNVCGLFVNVVGQKIYLLHQTAKEFLVAQKLSSSLRTPIQSEFKFWKNSVSLIEANSILTRICVFYLLFSEIDQATDEFPEDRLSKSERSASQRLRRRAESKQRQNCHFYGLLDYAGSHWVDHFQVAQRQADEAMLGAALELCDTQSNRFRRWYRLHRPDAAYNVEFWCRTSGTNLTATAHLGLHEVMKEMLKRHGINVNIRDKINRTPLHWAAARGYGNVVGQLLERDDIETNAQDDHGLTALLLASWQGQIDPDLDGDPLLVNNLIRYPADSMGLPLGTTSEECADVLRLLLAKNGIDVNACDHQKWTPLIAAASRGYTDIVGQLLEKDNVQVNFQGTGGMTALSWAAYRGYRKVVMQLLKVDGIKINIQDGWGMSPLSLAAIEGHVDVVKELLKADGIAINIQDNDGMSPLSYATNKDYTVVVKELLKADGITINIQDNHGMSPLSWAAWRSHLEVVRQLLADGRIDVEIKDMKSRTALDWARVESHNEVVQLLETAAEHQAKRRRLR